MRPAVFLDLNGTLVLPVLVESLDQLQPIPGAAQAVARLSAAGFLCPVVTIQSRIAKGHFSREEFESWFQALSRTFAAAGAALLERPYVCPHRFADPCTCKKPNTLLYERAAMDHGIDLRRSFVIGDSATDVEAAHRFRGCGILVRTGVGASAEEQDRATSFASYIAPSLDAAADWILGSPAPGTDGDR